MSDQLIGVSPDHARFRTTDPGRRQRRPRRDDAIGPLRRGLRSRCLHMIDIENLAGPGHRCLEALAFATGAYRATAPVTAGDLVVVACDRAPEKRFQVGLLWPAAQRLSAHGPDGADRALLMALDPAWLASRFSTVTIGSGDGAFADLARTLRARGVEVGVVARRGSLARDLRIVACQVRYVPGAPAPGLVESGVPSGLTASHPRGLVA